MSKISKISIIGGGNITNALISGWYRKPYDILQGIVVCDRNSDKRTLLENKYGITTVSDQKDIPIDSDIVILAVKNYELANVISQMNQKNAIIISLAVDFPIKSIEDNLPFSAIQIIRSMPNIPFEVGLGMSLFYANSISDCDKLVISKLFEIGGRVLWLKDETMLEYGAILSGGGPAYIYHFSEAMEAAGADMGFSSDEARMIVSQSIIGAGEIMGKSKNDLESLKNKVAVTGGVTERVIGQMESVNLSELIKKSILGDKKG